MIVTFATQKGGVGKTTLAVAFANYLSIVKNKKVKVFDYDFQKSFYQRWIDDEDLGLPQLYEVEKLDSDEKMDFQQIADMKSSDDFYLFDLAGTIDERYVDILTLSDFLIIPFEYSEFSSKSTIVFINLLGMLDSEAHRIFLRSRYEKNYAYKGKDIIDNQLEDFGKMLEHPVYKRNALLNINTPIPNKLIFFP